MHVLGGSDATRAFGVSPHLHHFTQRACTCCSLSGLRGIIVHLNVLEELRRDLLQFGGTFMVSDKLIRRSIHGAALRQMDVLSAAHLSNKSTCTMRSCMSSIEPH